MYTISHDVVGESALCDDGQPRLGHLLHQFRELDPLRRKLDVLVARHQHLAVCLRQSIAAHQAQIVQLLAAAQQRSHAVQRDRLAPADVQPQQRLARVR